MKRNIDKKFLKKIASNFSEVDASLIKEAMLDDLDDAPNSFFLDQANRRYPVGSPAHAYTSYLGAVCCGDKETATKIASILEDIYDITPPSKIPEQSKNKHTKVATDKNYLGFLPREERYIEKLASISDSNVSGDKARYEAGLRITLCDMYNISDENISKAYNKIASIVDEYDKNNKKMTREELAKVAAAVEAIDTKVGADRYYGKYISDPVDFVKAISVEAAPVSVKLGSVYINKDNSSNIKREYFEDVLSKEALDTIFDRNNNLILEKFASFIKSADKKTIDKIKKVVGLFDLV